MDIQLKQEIDLGSFNAAVRRKALSELHRLLLSGEVAATPEFPVVNLHCHTFFSFNAYGYSPTALAWLARSRGYQYLGIVDFDVLDGVDEFLDACELLDVRGSAGIETRVFLPEFARRWGLRQVPGGSWTEGEPRPVVCFVEV